MIDLPVAVMYVMSGDRVARDEKVSSEVNEKRWRLVPGFVRG